MHLEAYHRSYLPYMSNGGRGVPLETCTENLIPSKLCISFSLLTEQRPLQLSSWRSNRRACIYLGSTTPLKAQSFYKPTTRPVWSLDCHMVLAFLVHSSITLEVQ